MQYVPYIAMLSTIDEVLTDAHLRQDYEVIAYEEEWDREKGVLIGKLTVPNPGLALLDPNRKQFVAVMESPDATVANARVFMKARVEPIVHTGGAAVGNSEVTLTLVAAPIDIQNRKWTFIIANCQQMPQFDALFEDMDFSRPDSVLEAVSGFFLVDPVTHAISINDNLDGLRTIDIGAEYDYRTLRIDFVKPPAKRVKLTIVADWTQRAYGNVNIASKVVDPGTGVIQTMDAEHFEHQEKGLPTSLVNYSTGTGWSKQKGQTDVAYGYVSVTPYIFTGREYLITYEYDANANGVPEQDVDGNSNAYPTTDFVDITVNHSETAAFTYMTYAFLFHWMTYDYSQARRETVTIFLDYGIQNVGGVNTEEDLGSVSLKDLYRQQIENPTPAPAPDPNGQYLTPYNPYVDVKPYSSDNIYNAGDIVTIGLYTYRCTKNNSTGPLWYTVGYSPVYHTNFQQIPNFGAMTDLRQPSFFDTQRGQQAIEHGILRCRAKARNMSQAMTVEFETTWETAVGIKPTDVVRISYYDWNARVGRVIQGKVKSWTRRIDGKAKTIKLTLAVPLGDGTNVGVPQVGPAVFNDPATDAAAYYYSLLTPLALSQAAFQSQFVSLYNFTSTYDEKLLGSFGFGDVAWTYGSTPLDLPVDAFQLSDPNYAVVNRIAVNEVAVQFSQAINYGFRRWNPADAIFENPTSVNVTMRSLASAPTMWRYYDVAAQVMHCPRGIDLVDGGAP